MGRLTHDAPEVHRINDALEAWQQGDVVRGPVDFIHIGDPARPLTSIAAEASGDGPTVLVDEGVVGLVVLTQTCDIVRACDERPYIEVAPLVEVEESDLGQSRGATARGTLRSLRFGESQSSPISTAS